MRKVLPILTLLLFAVALVLPLSEPQTVEGQTATEALTADMDAKTDDLFNGFGAVLFACQEDCELIKAKIAARFAV